MSKIIKNMLSFIFAFIFVFSSVFCLADEREENLDLFLVLDKSLSMEEEISAVKEYIRESIVEEILIPGDFLVVIQFYGKAEILMAGEVAEDLTVHSIKEKIYRIQADGSFTDIGNALDALQEALKTYRHEENREYLLLITDGKQEAPEDSKYYSPDGAFNHAFLENADTIQKEGWKIQILGIGAGTAAKELAEKLSGGYMETSEEPTKEELKELTKELFGIIELSGTPEMTPVDDEGNAVLSLPLSSSDFTEEQTVKVNTVRFLSGEAGIGEAVIAEKQTFTVPPNGETVVAFPVDFPDNLPKGTIIGTLVFTFDEDTVFTPATMEASIQVKGFIANNIWLIPVIVVGVAAIALGLFFLFRSRQKSKPCKFRVYVDNRPLQTAPYEIMPEGILFISQEGIGFAVNSEKGDKDVAKLEYHEEKLVLTPIDLERFAVNGEIPENVLGRKVEVKQKSGLQKEIFFKAVS